jgi:hypothetical protein
MSDFILGSICLTTLIEKAKSGHSAFSKSPKDGKVYFNYAEWINDEPNEFGQHSSILLSSSKDMKEQEGKVYIGNGKKFENKPVTSKDLPGDDFGDNIPVREPKKKGEESAYDVTTPPIDDLPF